MLKHGYDRFLYNGIRKVSQQSKCLVFDSPLRYRLMYDCDTFEIWVSPRMGDSWIDYGDVAIVDCGVIDRPVSYKTVNRMVTEALMRGGKVLK